MPGDAAISVISYGELIYGAEKSLDRDRTLRTLLDLVTLIPVLPLPARAGELYGMARRILEQKGMMIGSNDLWIAAHGLAEDAVVVTNNVSEFIRVPGLKVENWTG